MKQLRKKTKLLAGGLLLAIGIFTAPVVFADDPAPAAAVEAVAPELEDAEGPAVAQELSPAAEAVAETAASPEVQGVAVEVDPNLTFMQLLLKSIGDMKGATTIAIVAIVIQLLLKILDLPIVGSWFSGTKGKTKLLIVGGLSFLLAPVTLVSTLGMDWGAALTHTTTLTAFMVFINQVYIQFVKKEA